MGIFNRLLGILLKKEVLKFKNKMERLHRYCSFNVELVKKSAKCHCFYCKSSFDASETLKEGAEILDDASFINFS